MGRKLALECRRCGGHIPLYAALAFVTAFCGILLWVNGVAAPIVFRTAVIPCAVLGLTGHFVLWLILYGLFGWLLGMLLTTPGISCVEPSLTVIYAVPGVVSGVFLAPAYRVRTAAVAHFSDGEYHSVAPLPPAYHPVYDMYAAGACPGNWIFRLDSAVSGTQLTGMYSPLFRKNSAERTFPGKSRKSACDFL